MPSSEKPSKSTPIATASPAPVPIEKTGDGTIECERLDVEERRREKQASRDEDQRQLDAGEITREELAKRNGSFAFPRDRVRVDFPKGRK